jgi:pimeloyl-ACP methyl ester carboxylesterase
LSYLRQQTKDNIRKYIDERLPEEYEKCLVGLTAILREAWNTSQQAEDRREKIQALSLAKDCYSMKLLTLLHANEPDFVMNEKKDNFSFHPSFCLTAIFLKIIIIVATGIFVISFLILNQNQTAIAQQQQQLFGSQSNQTLSSQRFVSKDISFDIDNVTFSHHMASVNGGIQIHYVIGGHGGDPVVLLHGWPQTWYEWRHVMPSLAKNYTVIVPDLRGLGDSSKPITGYDGKTTAEDIHQLVAQLGFKDSFLVGHDLGALVAFSYAAAHPSEVRRLVILDVPITGIGQPLNSTRLWHIPFHMVRDIPETLVEGKEREYLTWFYSNYSYNPAAITKEDIDEYVSHYSAPGGMRAGFEYYRAFPIDAEQIKEYSKVKLPMPVLALGGENSFGTAPLVSMQSISTNVRGGIVPFSGHWIPEEQPDFVVDQLFKFFGNSTK